MANTTKRILNQKGLTLVESIAALAVTGIILAGGVRLANDRMDDIKAQAAAKYQQQVDDAATRYIHDNFSSITAVSTATTPAKITVAMLQSTGYLPASFSSMNGYGQTACVLALQPTANKLQTLVVTEGGQSIPTKRTPLVAASIGASGGYIPNPATGSAKGAYGAWTLPLSGYTSTSCSGTPAGPDHLATALFFDNGNLISDYLYRNAVPGHPEANQMATALDMTNNNINNGGTINATKVSLPNGNSLQVGGTTYNSNGTDSVIKQNGWLYVQNPSGGNNNVYANDVYIASVGKWASQLGSPPRIINLGGAQANGWWTYTYGRKPLYIMVELADCGMGNYGGYWQAVEYNASGVQMTGGINLGGSNYNGGPDGGSGMCNMQTATIPFVDGAVTMHIYPVQGYLQYAYYIAVADQ